ncbi:His Kinase A (phospho-acceptor) domain-containing protein [Streptomyces sp. WMMB 714]|uniref:HAMP domain-containing sensor histidine kinase n=1 Tax=Streptomyces sp. WMMB 714 TaxID=1286822 RepID=UPI0005F766A8|nr:ATP-binding protein [Streptomyces sp. WMMB 714]SCK11902.1 His Kinase A (phospho-acceptor) domain-containing protein [Streptomyces sp. WMMB 714]
MTSAHNSTHSSTRGGSRSGSAAGRAARARAALRTARTFLGLVLRALVRLHKRLRRRWEPVWTGWIDRLWEGLRPLDPYRSVKAALGALVIVSVVITTLLALFAVNSATELRVITIISIIASLLITQFVAQSLTAPLDEMTDAARAMADGDYSRRVRGDRRDEFGELAETFNRMAADLEAVDQHRKELVANVSHELRTPIAALRAVLENVVDGVSDADPETMRTALQQTDRLGRLVATLLDLSRLDNGVVPLHSRRFEVWPYLAGVLKEANMSKGQGHARTDVHLHLDVSPPELTAYADAERLHQVVANLIDNAVKHSPPHGRVTVRARPGSSAESLEVEVLDEGPGIPASERARVFERFNRTKSAEAASQRGGGGSGSDGGTGLGLAIARWAVDLHGGSIRVAESPRGCRIQVTLPGLAAPEG